MGLDMPGRTFHTTSGDEHGMNRESHDGRLLGWMYRVGHIDMVDCDGHDANRESHDESLMGVNMSSKTNRHGGRQQT